MLSCSSFSPTCVWNKKVEDGELEKFKKRISTKYGTKFETYWDFHEWSIKNYSIFWEEILIHFDVKYSGTYQEVSKKTGNLLTDIEWFSGAKINYAENLLRYRDEKIALICIDEDDNEEILTYAQIYQKVKMYAAALRKLGLKPEDMVACYMSNRQEAVFAMLAVISLGGIWGGPLPIYGLKGALSILKQMRPKFFFTVDSFKYEGTEYNILRNLPVIAHALETLEKVIVIPSKPESLSVDLTGIKNSCFLQEFLNSGKNSDGSYPDISFLQLPFNHPIYVSFTSGTTGLPKGFIHSAVTLLPLSLFFGLHANITNTDVTLATDPVGWTSWNIQIFNLCLGTSIVLYNGDPFLLSQTYFWDLLSKYKITYMELVTDILDNVEKNEVVPKVDSDLKNLKMILIGSSPVKVKNFNFLRKCIKNENVFIGNVYSCTEISVIGGLDLSMPACIDEIQVPALGLDLKCYDKTGHSVIGKHGELIIATPNPGLPLGLINDKDKHKLMELYFSKYEGVWNIHDNAWWNPITKGIAVLGRSDLTILQHGHRFNSTDIYSSIHGMEEVSDYLCISQSNFRQDHTRCVLFVVIKESYHFTDDLVNKISKQIKNDITVLCVPEKILKIKEIPYNLNNKKMESLVKQIVATNEVPEVNNSKNPECLKHFVNITELQNY